VPVPGADVAALRAAWGEPTGRWAAADGAPVLEWADGPFGRTTWLVTLDAAGRVRSADQVLAPARLAAFQDGAEGLTEDEVRRRLGRPGEVLPVGFTGGRLWAWRYETNNCLWFLAEFTREGRVKGTAFAPDPLCDGGDAHD
jgi:hypothetical protein